MFLLFENLGRDTNKLQQEDCKDICDFVWEYCKPVENEPVFTLQDFKDAYIYAKEESMKIQ